MTRYSSTVHDAGKRSGLSVMAKATDQGANDEQMLKKIAPYRHARLSVVKLAGDPEQPAAGAGRQKVREVRRNL
jgi:hypothetical protein